MQRRKFLQSSLSTLAAMAVAPSTIRASNTALQGRTRRILYVLAQFAQATPKSMQTVVDTIGNSSFNVVVLSFLQASVVGGKLALLYNGNEFSSLAPEVPALLARLRSGFRVRKQIMLSVGGWQHLATFDAIRSFGVSAFVRQLTQQVIQPLGLDGIDLDLEPQKGGLDQWVAAHNEYGKLLAELTNEYKRVHPIHLVTHAPISSVAAELYAKPAPIPGLSGGLLAATRTKNGNNIDWLNVQLYEGGIIDGGDIAAYYRDSLATPLMKMRAQTGIAQPLNFLMPLFQPKAKQPLEFCRQTIEAIDRRCADLSAGNVRGVALWDYRQVASSIQDWSQGLEVALHG